jgi:hypothetical protein
VKSTLYSKAILLGLIFTSACSIEPDSDAASCGGNKFLGFSLADIAGTWETGSNPSYSDSYESSVDDSSVDESSSDGSSDDSDSNGCRAGKHAKKMSSVSSESESEDMMSDSSASTESKEGMSMPAPSDIKGGGQNAGPQILTAGTFDDSLNFDSFKSFWNEKKENNQGTDIYFENPTSATVSLPTIEQITPATRFGGSKPTALDLSLVVDVTGSMGDELEYIKAEIEHISASVKEQFPNVAQRFSLIVYRDDGDQYKTRGIDLTADLSTFKTFLGQQSAGGGGDYPEAMHTALTEARDRLTWGDTNTAKLLFLIADAPPHDQSVKETLDAVQGLKDKGVHIYPVAASGVADLAERIMRYAAVVSGGEYIFLTDDSRVGNPHAVPHIPCYNVRKLNDVMADVIKSELNQERIEPDQKTIVRNVGKPVMGKCE